MFDDYLNTDLASALKYNPGAANPWIRPFNPSGTKIYQEPNPFGGVPSGPLPTLDKAGSVPGPLPTQGSQMAIMLSMLGKAFAKPRYDAKGNKVSTFGERLSEPVMQMAQAQMMAKALAAGGTSGAFNPWMFMSLFGGK